VHPDLYDVEAWRSAAASLDQKIQAARTQPNNLATHISCDALMRLCRRCRDDLFWDEQRVAIKQQRQAVLALSALQKNALELGADCNEIPFPMPSGFDPTMLQVGIHADLEAFDVAVDGEAAWQCCEQGVVDIDKLTETQRILMVARASRGAPSEREEEARQAQLRRHFQRYA